MREAALIYFNESKIIERRRSCTSAGTSDARADRVHELVLYGRAKGREGETREQLCQLSSFSFYFSIRLLRLLLTVPLRAARSLKKYNKKR